MVASRFRNSPKGAYGELHENGNALPSESATQNDIEMS